MTGPQYNTWYALINDRVIDSALNIRRPFERRFVERALNIRPGERVLEIGCNKGKFLTMLIDKGVLPASQAFGVDVNADGIAFAKANGRGTYKLMDAMDLDFKEASFDKAFMIHVLEHVPDYKAALVEAYRVLKPGGTMVITLPLDIFRPYIFKVTGACCRLLGLHKKKLDTRKFWHQVAQYLMNNPHLHVFRIASLLRVMRGIGFVPVGLRPCCYMPIIPLGRPKPANVRGVPSLYDLVSYSCTFVLRKPDA